MVNGRTTQKLMGWSTFVHTAACQISVKNRRKLQMVINRLNNAVSFLEPMYMASVNKFSSVSVIDPQLVKVGL